MDRVFCAVVRAVVAVVKMLPHHPPDCCCGWGERRGGMDGVGGVETLAGLVTAKVGGVGSIGVCSLELTSLESRWVRLVLMP